MFENNHDMQSQRVCLLTRRAVANIIFILILTHSALFFAGYVWGRKEHKGACREESDLVDREKRVERPVPFYAAWLRTFASKKLAHSYLHQLRKMFPHFSFTLKKIHFKYYVVTDYWKTKYRLDNFVKELKRKKLLREKTFIQTCIG